MPKLILKMQLQIGLKAETNGDKEDRLSKINQKMRDDSTPNISWSQKTNWRYIFRDPSRPPEADEEVATEESAKNPEEIKSATNAELERLKVS